MVENSVDGITFKQMRIFHMHQVIKEANIGVYACSPLESSIKIDFSEFVLGECMWENYVNPDLG
jgi:regulation of enolase protein 1 (concanavalin A-like superfamily)